MNNPTSVPSPGPGRPLLSAATIGGRCHRIWRQNSHDAALGDGDRQRGAWWGLVLDGCGSKTVAASTRIPAHNEVGAKLSGQFISGWWRRELAREAPAPLHSLFEALHRDYIDFLAQLTALIAWEGATMRATFCGSHLLATVVGFVVTPTEAAFYWRGDGFLCSDGTVAALASDNRPDYAAYDLLEAKEKDGAFQTRYLNRRSLSWLAVASDGWQPALLAELSEPRSSLALQRWLNVRARERGVFDDDGAVAALYLGDEGREGPESPSRRQIGNK